MTVLFSHAIQLLQKTWGIWSNSGLVGRCFPLSLKLKLPAQLCQPHRHVLKNCVFQGTTKPLRGSRKTCWCALSQWTVDLDFFKAAVNVTVMWLRITNLTAVSFCLCYLRVACLQQNFCLADCLECVKGTVHPQNDFLSIDYSCHGDLSQVILFLFFVAFLRQYLHLKKNVPP